MRSMIIGAIAVVGFLALAESLTCNQCSVGLVGFCLRPTTTDCNANTSSCYTGKASFPSISGFVGFNTQGCLDSSLCNITYNGTVLGASYVISSSCCTTDKCNPVQISGAPYMQLSLPVALGATLLAFFLGNSI
ncbi:hypothetical protein NFI96_024163 [Prochilodus magdalenae]|nr:hypothetical protein NFI96_024163 [Prochilodus magdalenae]